MIVLFRVLKNVAMEKILWLSQDFREYIIEISFLVVVITSSITTRKEKDEVAFSKFLRSFYEVSKPEKSPAKIRDRREILDGVVRPPMLALVT